MIPAPWVYDDRDRCWSLNFRFAWVQIQHRPHYCDRGRYIAVVEGIGSIDQADEFPRYFMDLDRAKAEMSEWLGWRLRQIDKPSTFDAWRAKALAVDQLTLAVRGIMLQELANDDEARWLRGVLDGLHARYGSAR